MCGKSCKGVVGEGSDAVVPAAIAPQENNDNDAKTARVATGRRREWRMEEAKLIKAVRTDIKEGLWGRDRKERVAKESARLLDWTMQRILETFGRMGESRSCCRNLDFCCFGDRAA